MRLHHAIGIEKVLLYRFSVPNLRVVRRKPWLNSTPSKLRAYSAARNSILHNGPDDTKPIPQSLSKSVRKAMRTVPHPVMVITATTPDKDPMGLLVSSFNTVTLHPEPLVSFNIKLPSSTYDRVAETGEFSATSIWSTETANRYTKPLSRLAEFPRMNSPGMIQGAIFSFRCIWLKEKSVEVGDHVIMVGRVTEYTHIPAPPQEAPKVPLMYCNGRYWKAPHGQE
ncbi:hypothetical protein MMC26_007117 [Xylographa opegraphella]|nr:hypothetical protein [Xylographa opegraphella]